MMTHRTMVCVLAVCALAVGASPTAHGYVLYTSETNPEAYLRWFETEMVYVIDDVPPQEMVAEVADEQIIESFDTWSTLSCDGVSVPHDFQFGGHVEGRSVGHNDKDLDDNENLVIWIQDMFDWDYSPDILALTSLTYDTENGEIVDVDLEINDAFFTFSADAGPGEIDVRNTVVHEVGHMLGLDHSMEKKATMFAKAPPGETQKRDLEQDDIDGYCALYGPNALPIPPKGVNVVKKSGCALQQPTTQSPGSLWILLLGLMGLALRRGRLARSTRP
jgi:hypothetical protein